MSESLDNHLVHGRRQRPDGPSPIDVISVQSQLVYGHAGNSNDNSNSGTPGMAGHCGFAGTP